MTNTRLILKEMLPFRITMASISAMDVIMGKWNNVRLFFPGEGGKAIIRIYTIVIAFSLLILCLWV